jgi:hypothetical protein
MQEAFNRTFYWSTKLQLPILFGQCSMLIISKRHADDETTLEVRDNVLSNLNDVIDLGIVVDSRPFIIRISRIVKNAHRRANLIECTFLSNHIPTLLQACKICTCVHC